MDGAQKISKNGQLLFWTDTASSENSLSHETSTFSLIAGQQNTLKHDLNNGLFRCDKYVYVCQ
jgi:hypothetical protein